MARFRLKVVLTVAQDREEKARQALEKQLITQQQAEQQLQQLREYALDYERRQRGGNILTPFQWQSYQDFLLRLEQAMAIQEQVCREQQQKTEQLRTEYRKHQRFLKGMELLQHKHTVVEMQRQEKAEQKLMDEFATRKRVFHR
jgi:flagellar protein FliJ